MANKDGEHEEGDETDHYLLTGHDRVLLTAAQSLLHKVLRSNQLDPSETRSVAKLLGALNRLPQITYDQEVQVTVSGPTRQFGEVETWHWWDVGLDFGTLQLKSGGHFYRPSTGGDSFTTMTWEAAPGEAGDFTDYRDSLAIVPDVCTYEEGVARIDFSGEEFAIEVTDYHADDEEDVSDQPQEGQGEVRAHESTPEDRTRLATAMPDAREQSPPPSPITKSTPVLRQVRESATIFVAVVGGLSIVLAASIGGLLALDHPEQWWKSLLLVIPAMALASWVYWPKLKSGYGRVAKLGPVFLPLVRWLPVLLFCLSVSFSPYRSSGDRFSSSERIFRPLYLPPAAGDYRLDFPLLAAQWLAIVGLAVGSRYYLNAPKS